MPMLLDLFRPPPTNDVLLCTPWSSTWTGGRIVGKARPVTTFFTKSRTCINLPSLSNICEYYLLIWSILSEHCIRCTSLRLHNSDGFWWGISNRLKEFQVWVEIFRLFFGSRNVWQSQRVVFNLVTGCHSTVLPVLILTKLSHYFLWFLFYYILLMFTP